MAGPGKRRGSAGVELERLTGIEPAYQAWEASALPLSYSRSGTSQSAGLCPGETTRFTLPQSEFEVVHAALAWPVPRRGWRDCDRMARLRRPSL